MAPIGQLHRPFDSLDDWMLRVYLLTFSPWPCSAVTPTVMLKLLETVAHLGSDSGVCGEYTTATGSVETTLTVVFLVLIVSSTRQGLLTD